MIAFCWSSVCTWFLDCQYCGHLLSLQPQLVNSKPILFLNKFVIWINVSSSGSLIKLVVITFATVCEMNHEEIHFSWSLHLLTHKPASLCYFWLSETIWLIKQHWHLIQTNLYDLSCRKFIDAFRLVHLRLHVRLEYAIRANFFSPFLISLVYQPKWLHLL